MPLLRVLVFLTIVVVAVFIGNWWWSRRSVAPTLEVRNVLLISLDTCRADRLSCYGYQNETTPHIDALAEESTLFTNALAAVPMTLPSHCTMLTGTNPPYHGVHDNLNHLLSKSNETLAEILQRNGFVTGAIVSTFVLDSQFGMDQGFDTYHDEFEQAYNLGHYTERKGDEVTRFALRWLDQHHDERFFLFLHYFDPHDPYEPPEPFATRFKNNRYDGEIAFTDDCVGKVLQKLKQLQLYDNTLIIVVGDHGEMLGEHGEQHHMYFIYQSALNVPLIFKLPGRAVVRRIDEPVGVIDIVRTVCGLLNFETPPQVRGEDLSMALAGAELPSHRYRYCESVTPTQYQANSLLGVVGGRWKFIQTTRPELYDLQADPTESNNLVHAYSDEAMRLQAALNRMLQDEIREEVTFETTLDAESLRKIETLGYVGGSGDTDRRDYYEQSLDLDDPKDLIGFHNDYTIAVGLAAGGELAEARQRIHQLVERRTNFLNGYLKLADIADEQEDPDSVLVYLNRALTLHSESTTAHSFMGKTMAKKGQWEAAIASFERAVDLAPKISAGHVDLGMALAAAGRNNAAIQRYGIALELDPDSADAHFRRGLAYSEAGQAEMAVVDLTRALELTPGNPQAHQHRGIALMRQRRWERAADEFTRAIELEPELAMAYYYRANVHRKLGRREDAVNDYDRALELQPDHIDSLSNRGGVQMQLGRYGLALIDFDRAVQLDGDSFESFVNRGITYQRLQRPERAIDDLTRAIELNPDFADAYQWRGQCYQQAGRNALALADYQHAIELNPRDPYLHNQLAWLLATSSNPQTRDGDNAVAAATRACELTGWKEAGLLDTLAAAHARVGDFENAIQWQQKALQLGSEKMRQDLQTRLELYRQRKAYPPDSAD